MKPTQSTRNAAFVGFAILASSLAVGAGASYASSTTSVSATTVPNAADTDADNPAEPDGTDAETGDVGYAIEEIDAVAVGSEEFAQEYAAMSPDDQAELVAKMTSAANEAKQDLDDAGVAYTLDVDPVTGVSWPLPDPNDPAADAVTASWAPVEVTVEAGAGVSFDSLSDDDRAEVIEQMTNDAANIAKEFDAAGIAYTLDVDDCTGVSWPVPNEDPGDIGADGSFGDHDIRYIGG